MARPIILCVDDERTALTALQEQLRRAFGRECVVEVAESGPEALGLIDELVDNGDDVAVVISDHIMPGMRGDELLVAVHERLPEVKTIMLTGQASIDAVGTVVNRARLYRYLSKPWDARDLELTVRSALESVFGDRAREEQQAMLREMAEVSLALTANLAAGDRYARLVESARRVLRADRAVVFRRDVESIRPLASSHPGPIALGVERVGELAFDLVAASPTRRSGSAATALSLATLGWTAQDRSLITAPLRVGDEAVGLLVVGSDRLDAHRAASDERIVAFAALAAASIRTTELVDALELASEQRRRVAEELQREAAQRGSGALLGDSPEIQSLRLEISLRANAPRPSLIIGPPGSGCESVARSYHEQAGDGTGPFIMVEAMLVRDSSELFGDADSRTGVISGPAHARVGKLGLAQGGTLYIAGVEALPKDVQRELARRIERGVGACVVASARRDPGSALDPALRQVLDARWIQVPALRDRLGDLPALAAHFLKAHARRTSRDVERLSDASIDRMKAHAWPGNVRELSHVIERAVLSARGPVVEVGEVMLTGASVGSYELVERLGAGGMGEVWKAQHLHLARPAAVKLIRDDGTRNPADLERFRREASATAGLRSPHTVELYDFGVTSEGELYYVMELLDGLDLHRLVDKYGPLPAGRAISLVRQACLSLGEAHAVGLVHRDVKPANLFICQLGLEVDFLKVLDFGVVSVIDDVSLTQDGQLAGTPAFMAPESVSDQRDGRADLYALGCVLHWLLTGRYVFQGQNVLQVLRAHVTDAPPLTSSVANHPVSPGLDALIQRCLAKSPADRPATALQLYDELGELEDDVWTRNHAHQWWTGMRLGTIHPRSAPVVSPPSLELTRLEMPVKSP